MDTEPVVLPGTPGVRWMRRSASAHHASEGGTDNGLPSGVANTVIGQPP